MVLNLLFRLHVATRRSDKMRHLIPSQRCVLACEAFHSSSPSLSPSSSYHRDLAEVILSSPGIDERRESTNTDESNLMNHMDMKRRIALSKAITLIESKSPTHRDQADLLLNEITRIQSRSSREDVSNCEKFKEGNNQHACANATAKLNGSSHEEIMHRPFRVGITGPPGVGKSTFIETFGKFLLNLSCDRKEVDASRENLGDEEKVENIDVNVDEEYYHPNKVAVVCIDPSSVISGGSILGDKTRMTELSRHPRAYVRPSPSKGVLGGLASYTDECCLLCEAAGHDLVLVETVGLGQSEVDVSQAVDMLILMVAPGGGDHLQGSKKGVLEVSDMLIVNKADGNLMQAARNTAMEYKAAIHMFRPRIEGWETPPVLLASSSEEEERNISDEMMLEVWKEICRYRRVSLDGGQYDLKRLKQRQYWMWKHVQDLITSKVWTDENVRRVADELEKDLHDGSITSRAAAAKLLELSAKAIRKSNGK